jgi:membrane protease YdiL (CAAX protease family)
MNKLFSLRELRLFAGLVLLALAGVFFFFTYADRSFPEMNVSFTIDPETASQKSEAFLSGLNLDLNGYRRAQNLDENDLAKRYLEKTLGPNQAGSLLNDQVSAWGFSTRFFKPFEQKEYFVTYDNLGRLKSVNSVIPEDQAGDRLDEDAAKAIALAFLKEKTDYPVPENAELEADAKDQPNRKDYAFTWIFPISGIQDAKYKVQVRVAGKDAVGYDRWLDVPEAWQRDDAKLYGPNETAQNIASFADLGLFSLPILFFILRSFKRKQLKAKLPLKISLALLVINVLILASSYKLLLWRYDTTESAGAFITFVVLGAVLASVGVVLSKFYNFLALQTVEAEQPEERSKFFSLFEQRLAWRQKPQLFAVGLGYLAGLLVMAYQVGYYLLGGKLGYWVPAESSFNSSFVSFAPYLAVLATGLFPALAEEIVYRAFGIHFLKKFLKKTWLAALLSSLVWAFLHSAYPQQPFFARGLELLPVGLAFSWLYWRYGLLASISAHFTLNAGLTAIYLAKQSSTFVSVMAIGISQLPLLIALTLLAVALKKGFVDKLDTAPAVPAPEAPIKQPAMATPAAPAPIFSPLSRRRSIACLAAILLIVPTFFVPIKDQLVDKSPKAPEFTIDRRQALDRATSYLKDRGVNTEAFRSYVAAHDYFDDTDQKYLLEQPDGATMLNSLYQHELLGQGWEATFYKIQDPERYSVTLWPDGTFHSYAHNLAEEAPGSKLSKEDARAIATSTLAQQYSLDLTKQEQADESESLLKNRNDHSFTFKETDRTFGEATLKTSIDITGGEPDNFSRWLDIPEHWLRDRDKTTTAAAIQGSLFVLLGLMFMVMIIATWLKLFRAGRLKWRPSRYLAGGLTLILGISSLNRLTTYFAGYNTIDSLNKYHFEQISVALLGLLVSYTAFWLAFNFLHALLKDHVTWPRFATRETRVRYLFESALLGYGAMAASIFVVGGGFFLLDKYDPRFLNEALIILPSLPTGISDYLPWLTKAIDYISYATSVLMVIPFLVLRRYLKAWPWVILFQSGIAFAMQFPITDKTDFIDTSIVIAIIATAALLSWQLAFKRNNLAIVFFALAVAGIAFIDSGSDLSAILKNAAIVLALAIPFPLFTLAQKPELLPPLIRGLLPERFRS